MNDACLQRIPIKDMSAETIQKEETFTLSAVENYIGTRNIAPGLFFLFLIYLLVIYKAATLAVLNEGTILLSYSFLVVIYIISRFVLSYFYDAEAIADRAYTPTITFVTPAKNEAENIGHTLRAMLLTEYPKAKMEIIAINDGSTDSTLDTMLKVKKEADDAGIHMEVIDWKVNRGKRHGMAEGVRRATGDILIFIDSDSFVVPSTARELVKYFVSPNIGAVSGHCDVYNKNTNMLTKMQAVRFLVAFRAYKAAEAFFGCVTCCSGCCAAYRREYVTGIIDEWLDQKFLGSPCTYGDDRALTNCLLKQGYDAIYSEAAYARTVVPDNWSKFLKQQLRWKKSWTRESLLAMKFMWRKNAFAFLSFALGVILPLMSPIIVIRVFLWLPTVYGIWPFVYILGLIYMSFIYGMYYRIFRRDNIWVYGMLFTWFYTLVLIWQLPYAILTLRDSSWGTR